MRSDNPNSGQSGDSIACDSARVALASAVDFQLCLPNRIFAVGWNDFLFFHADSLFEPDFVETVKLLLHLETGRCACVAKLEPSPPQPNCFFMRAETVSEDYLAVLNGDRSQGGWIYSMGRFGVISDADNWCIYCEREEEFAVVAFREKCPTTVRNAFANRFGAAPIKDALADPKAFAPAVTLPWRLDLLRNFGNAE